LYERGCVMLLILSGFAVGFLLLSFGSMNGGIFCPDHAKICYMDGEVYMTYPIYFSAWLLALMLVITGALAYLRRR